MWPGQPMTAHWGITDPAAARCSPMERERAYVDASRYLKNRVSLFLALPLSKLAPLSLNARLREIGYAEGGSSPRSDVA